ncbi:MAG: hypothetical protein NZ899_14805 [Thermoguttaceae bacterium]|nr:hypothetical protein [Thermoguttaceae bacterium]MDW8080204.1 hypothetical protein [Thermoguttaceae bacterium]
MSVVESRTYPISRLLREDPKIRLGVVRRDGQMQTAFVLPLLEIRFGSWRNLTGHYPRQTLKKLVMDQPVISRKSQHHFPG